MGSPPPLVSLSKETELSAIKGCVSSGYGRAVGDPPFSMGDQGSKGKAVCILSVMACLCQLVSSLPGSCLHPTQIPTHEGGQGPRVGQDLDWLCPREKRGPCQGSRSAGQFALMTTHMSVQIGPQRHQNESLAIVEEIPLHLGRPVKAADCTTSRCQP